MKLRQRMFRLGALVLPLVAGSVMPPGAMPSQPLDRVALFTHVQPIRTDAAAGTGAMSSVNWAGYEQGVLKHDTPFTQVSASWVVPTVSVGDGSERRSSIWVGIGGGCPDVNCNPPDVDPTLVQAGTEQGVTNGHTYYRAWFEQAPNAPDFASLTIHPGDTVTVDVRSVGTGRWSLTITDGTQQAGIEYRVSAMLTAEWILEAPLTSSGIALLPAMCVQFANALVNDGPAALNARERIEMHDPSTHQNAVPSAPTSGSTAFSVCTS